MSLKDQAKSINQKLSNIAKKRKVGFQNIATEFLIERLLARLLHHKTLGKNLIFKGGFVAMRLYESPRYTVDLDALAERIRGESLANAIQESITAELQDAAWFQFQEAYELETQGDYGGTRFVFRAGIGEPLEDLRRAQIIHLDIGFGDPVTPAPIETKTYSLLETGELSWKAYPIETMIAEKLQALVSRGDLNSRSKDILDLSLFLPKANPKTLGKALKNTFLHCKTDLPKNLVGELMKINSSVLKLGWTKAVANIPNAPDFEIAFGSMIESLKTHLGH